MSSEFQLTAGERRKLEEELTQLRSVEMPALAERIRQARDLGDLSENFDYQDSKRQQGFVSGRMKDIEAILSRAEIVEEAQPGSGVVGLGSVVTLRDLDYDEDLVVTVVGSSGTDASQDRISATSPVGKELVGKKVGDQISVATPGGTTTFAVLDIK